MGAAVNSIDRIGKGEHRLGVCIRELHGHVDHRVFDLFFAMENGVQSYSVTVEVTHKGADAALKVEGDLTPVALVVEHNAHRAGDESHLAQALDQCLETVIDVPLENGWVKFEGGACAGARTLNHLAHTLYRPGGLAAFVVLGKNLPLPANFDLAPFRQGVNRRHAHTLQAAGYLVAAPVEFAAGVQHGHHHFQG